jgi:hypothetical protein
MAWRAPGSAAAVYYLRLNMDKKAGLPVNIQSEMFTFAGYEIEAVGN